MRIAYLVSGAAGMYCGSCLRDNRAAAAMLRQGRDVVLIPLYTPIRTDERDVSSRRVYYGGLGVYLKQHSVFFRRLPGFLDRLLDSPRLLARLGRFAGRTRAEQLGALTVAVLEGEHGPQARELEKLLAGLAGLKPDVVHLPMLLFLGAARRIRQALHVPILCTLSGEDVFVDALPHDYRRRVEELIVERAADVDAFVTPTHYYGGYAAERFRLARPIHYVPMGVDVRDVGAVNPDPGDCFTIGYLARIAPEKGLANLILALEQLKKAGRNCQVLAAGYLGTADRPYLRRVEHHVRTAGLTADFRYLGEVDRPGKIAFLKSLHVLCVPTTYHEAKGLYVLEALACGVPVVQPNIGSFPELVQATGGGLLFEPTGPDALADPLARLMDDTSLRRTLAEAGRDVVHRNFTDDVMAAALWNVYQQVHTEASRASTSTPSLPAPV